MYQQGMTIEASYSFKTTYNIDGSIGYSFSYNNGLGTSVGSKTGGNWFADIHFHPRNSFPEGGLFSWQDIKGLRDLYSHANPMHQDDNDVACYLIAPDPYNSYNYHVYAITVKNLSILDAAVDAEFNSSKWGGETTSAKARQEAINNYFGGQFEDNAGTLERYFLDTFASYGISLYKLENNTWNELLKSEANTTSVIKKPCK